MQLFPYHRQILLLIEDHVESGGESVEPKESHLSISGRTILWSGHNDVNVFLAVTLQLTGLDRHLDHVPGGVLCGSSGQDLGQLHWFWWLHVVVGAVGVS